MHGHELQDGLLSTRLLATPFIRPLLVTFETLRAFERGSNESGGAPHFDVIAGFEHQFVEVWTAQKAIEGVLEGAQ